MQQSQPAWEVMRAGLRDHEGAIMVMMPQAALEEMRAEIRAVKSLIEGKAVEDANAMWIESEEARKMLGISPRHWQTMRDRREIPFSQYGRKIYVRRADLESFLQEHMITSEGGKQI